jgi:hypothetical protein
MDNEIKIEDKEIITHSLLQDLKNMVVDLNILKDDNKLLKDKFQLLISQHEHIRSMVDDLVDVQLNKIKIPHRCPVCNGSTYDEEGDLCLPCDGRGIVWG